MVLDQISSGKGIDVAPTIADVLGISPPEQRQGRKIHMHDNDKP
jgi:arylsulfatase A-like enzyme